MSFQPQQVISLGGTCQPKVHLSRLGCVSPTGPFDNIISDFDAATAILSARGDALGASATPKDDLSTCYDDRYGVTLHHDYRWGSDPVEITDTAKAYTAAKYRERWASMEAACSPGSPTLFVRIGTFIQQGQMGPFRRQDRPLDAAAASRLCWTLDEVFPGLDYRVLLLVHADRHPVTDEAFDPRLHVEEMPLPELDSPTAWMGLDSAWDDLAARHAFPKAPEGYCYWW